MFTKTVILKDCWMIIFSIFIVTVVLLGSQPVLN